LETKNREMCYVRVVVNSTLLQGYWLLVWS